MKMKKPIKPKKLLGRSSFLPIPMGKKEHLSTPEEERSLVLSSKSGFFAREAYKTLRTNVTFSLAEDEEDCKIILVTSSLQSEGKSITALNLAISYAQDEKKVLIIDCDLRRPKLARLVDLSAEVGLSNILMKPELLETALLHSGHKGLDVILAGSIPPNPSELLGSARMERLLKSLREQYDFIILDTPPVNVVTDSVVLSTRCTGVLFVVRANHSERAAVMQAMEQLEYVKAKVLGFVLNGVDAESSHYGYKKYRYRRYSKYYGKYGYGKHGYGGYGYGGYGYGGYGYGGYGYGGYGYGYGYGRPPEEEAPAAGEEKETTT